MKAEDIKQEIAQKTGIPVKLLTGETVEENIAQAKALLAYKREHEQQPPRTTKEQFTDWLNEQAEARKRQTAEAFRLPYTPPVTDPASAELAKIEEQARIDAGGYPFLQDGGSVNVDFGDRRPAKEQFTDWLNEQVEVNKKS